MITLKPEIFSKVRESWYKTQLFKYCDGYDDVLDEHAFDELLNHNRTQGIKTRVFAKMRSIEKKQGVETALLEAENILKTEQDPFAAQNLLEYMGELERVGKAPIASNLPAGASLVYQPRDAMQLASEFAYCELAGGCGPYHLRTLRLCAGDIACPPGTTLRDFYGFVSPPVLVQAADVILARWRSLRQCGQYQCSR